MPVKHEVLSPVEESLSITDNLLPQTDVVLPLTEVVVVPLTDQGLPSSHEILSPRDHVLALQELEYVTSHVLFGQNIGCHTPPPPPPPSSSPTSVFTCNSHPLSFSC